MIFNVYVSFIFCTNFHIPIIITIWGKWILSVDFCFFKLMKLNWKKSGLSDEPVSGVNVDLLEMISKTMFGSMFPKVSWKMEKSSILKNYYCSNFLHFQLDRSLDTSLSSAASCSSGSSNVSSGHNSHSQSNSNSVVPQVPPIPGALAVAQSPTAQLFAEVRRVEKSENFIEAGRLEKWRFWKVEHFSSARNLAIKNWQKFEIWKWEFFWILHFFSIF